jgi:hypothetical protein
MQRRSLVPMVLSLVVPVLAGCGRSKPAAGSEAAAEASAEAPAAQPAPAAPSDPQPAQLTTADLDAYEKGVLAQIEAVRKSSERLKTAKTANDTLSAIGDALPANTQQIGAQAAGMDLERWKVVSGQIEAVLQAHSGAAMMAQVASPQAMDTVSLPPAERARVRENLKQAQDQMAQQTAQAYASLPPDLAATLKARAPHLDSLRLRLAGAQMSLGR